MNASPMPDRVLQDQAYRFHKAAAPKVAHLIRRGTYAV
jgi:hypothetical protein